jgi:anti-anti-sigma factor
LSDRSPASLVDKLVFVTSKATTNAHPWTIGLATNNFDVPKVSVYTEVTKIYGGETMNSIRTDLDGSRLAMKIAGRFTFQMYKDFSAAYKQYTDKPSAVDIDLRAVEYIDSAALGMLLSMRNHFGPDIKLSLSNANSSVRKILEIARFDKTFQIV